MKTVVYTEHLNLRLKIRKIPSDYPLLIFQNPEQKYYDVIEKTFIYIKKLGYNGRTRYMMIAFEEMEDEIRIITVHPVKEENIVSRVIRGRWENYER